LMNKGLFSLYDPLCQDEMWSGMISMYWNMSQCTIQQKNHYFLEIDYSGSNGSISNDNLLELYKIFSTVLLTSIWTAPKTPVQQVGKVQFGYQTPCTKSKVS
jgi:hypothetical protein